MTVNKNVFNLAKNELRSCYAKDGIIAGLHHFTDYWARDGYFAALGALEIGDHEVVEKMITLFYSFQRGDGLIPYRIMRGPTTLGKYLGKPSFYHNPKPTYKLRGFGKEVLDGTTLTVLFTALLGVGGWKKSKSYVPQIKKALSYLSSREKNELLWDGVMAEWNDSALKWGNLFYSNIIYWYMFNRLSTWIKSIDTNWANDLLVKEKSVADALHKMLWNGSYFADWYDYKRQNYLYPFGNCLAVAWGLTTKNESEKIIKACKKVIVDFTLETNFPKYPWWRIDPLQRLVGMGDFQNKSLLWWQPIISYLTALKRMRMEKEYNNLIKIIRDKILHDGSIYECYERNNKPVDRLIYKSERPFAWSAGMLLWVLLKT